MSQIASVGHPVNALKLVFDNNRTIILEATHRDVVFLAYFLEKASTAKQTVISEDKYSEQYKQSSILSKSTSRYELCLVLFIVMGLFYAVFLWFELQYMHLETKGVKITGKVIDKRQELLDHILKVEYRMNHKVYLRDFPVKACVFSTTKIGTPIVLKVSPITPWICYADIQQLNIKDKMPIFHFLLLSFVLMSFAGSLYFYWKKQKTNYIEGSQL